MPKAISNHKNNIWNKYWNYHQKNFTSITVYPNTTGHAWTLWIGIKILLWNTTKVDQKGWITITNF